MVNIGKHTVAGHSLAESIAVLLWLVLAPMGDAMGQAARHNAVCDHCSNAVVTVSDSTIFDAIPQDILEQIRAAALASNAKAVREASWGYSLDRLIVEFAEKGEVKGVRTLLAAGADVDAVDYFGNTPLHAATWAGHVDVVKVLLAAGAYLEAEAEDGKTPLHVATRADVVTILLDAGADIEARAHGRRTPLHHAARNGHADVVAALLAAGADIEARDNLGRTPRDLAKDNWHYKVANILKRAGADQ